MNSRSLDSKEDDLVSDEPEAITEEVDNIDEDNHESSRSSNSENNSSENATKTTTFSAKWTKVILKIHAPIRKVLQALTQTVANNPKRTISLVPALSIFLIVVGLLTNFTVDVDEDRLWTPSDSNAIRHMDWIDDNSGFPEGTQDLVMFFHANGANVLGKNQVARVFEALDAVRAVKNYDVVCSVSDYIDMDGTTTCEIDGVVNFWGLDSNAFAQEVTTDEEAIASMSQAEFPNGVRVSQNSVFGKPERYENGTLSSALSYTVVVSFPPTDDADNLEDDVLDILLALRDDFSRDQGVNLFLDLVADGSFGDEFERAIINDIPLLPLVFIVMSGFTALVFFKRDAVKSRSLLGFGAVVGVLLSLISGFGFLFLCGVPFTSMTQILPFVIFGIGLDDAFIIFGAYSRTDPSEESAQRIGKTIDEVGVSITLTSITSALAFGLGCLSTIPAVFWLCLYAVPTIVFVYLYSLTFFIAWIVLDERRIESNRRDCCFCINGKASKNDTANQGTQETENFMDNLMRRYAEFLLRPVVKAIVILAFIALAVACAISATELRQAFEFTEVLPDDSYIVDFLDATDEYTSRSSVAPYAYFRFANQSSEDIQNQMKIYVNELVALDVVEEEPENFWLLDFQAYVEREGLVELSFVHQLDQFLNETIYFDLYNGDIVRDEDGLISSSRVQLNFDGVDIDDVREQINTLEDQRDVSRRQPINQGENEWRFFSYDGIYNIWSFYEVCAEELMLTTIYGVVSVTAVALVFVPHFTAAFFIFPMICLLYVDLLGVMGWAGVDVNPVSYISLVMSIGLLVDFIMHVLLCFYEKPGNRHEKTVAMLQTMGSSVFIGGVSTFLGTMPLALSSSAIFNTIFIAFLGLVSLGIGHGLILLPVVLSLVGPEERVSCETTSKALDTEMATTTRTQNS